MPDGPQKELLANKTQSSTQFEKVDCSQSISFNPQPTGDGFNQARHETAFGL
jgi:hypothetical protein